MESASDRIASVDAAAERRAVTDRRWTPRAPPPNKFVAIGLALTFLIVMGDWLIVSMEREASVAAFQIAGSNLTKGMTAQTARMLGAMDDGLQAMPALLQIGNIASPELIEAKLRDHTARDLLIRRRTRMAGVASLTLVDAGGKVANSTGERLSAGMDVSGSGYFRALAGAAASAPYVGAPERNQEGDGWISFVAQPLTDSRGHFAGVIVAEVDLDDLEDLYRVAMPPRRVITVMRDDGTVLAQYPSGIERIGGRAKASPTLRLPRSGCTTYHGPDLVDGAPVVAGLCKLGNLPLFIETSTAEAEVLAGWDRERIWLGLGGVLTAIGVVWLLRIFARQVQRLEASELSLAAENRHVESARQQLDAALSNIPQGVCFFDHEHRLIVSNRRYLELYDLPEEFGRPGTRLSDIVDHFGANIGIRDSKAAAHLISLETVARANEPRQLVLELGDGRVISIRTQPMADGGWVATHEDITERRQAEERIAFLAKHDALTGLANRSLFLELAREALGKATRPGQFAILFLDLDRFKAVNDTLGHHVGDELLRGVAARLTSAVRGGGTVARLGGDEFVVLQNDIKSPEDAARLAGRIVEEIAAPYQIGKHEIVIGVSVGVDIPDRTDTTVEVLLENADIALYMAKTQGRGGFRFFEPEMDSHQRNRHRLELELRHALTERQFELNYQPIVDSTSGRVCAFEALLRWNHPERGVVEAEKFIAAAEDNGLVIPIGEWAIQQACWQAAQWPEEIRVSVNLSAAQFRAVSLVPTIRDALSATGLSADRLELEIKEAVLQQNNERNLAVLHQLRDLGVGIAIDDFGAGYSLMRYLREFPFSKIKIDRSFVRDLTNQPDTVFFVRAIVDLCRNLGIKTTAEGIESADQLSILLDAGCGELQGRLLGAPGPAASAAAPIGAGNLIPSRASAVRNESPPARIRAASAN